MASHCYLSGQPAELAVEFLVRHSAITDEDLNDLGTLKNEYFQDKRFEVIFIFDHVLFTYVKSHCFRMICILILVFYFYLSDESKSCWLIRTKSYM